MIPWSTQVVGRFVHGSKIQCEGRQSLCDVPSELSHKVSRTYVANVGEEGGGLAND